MVTARKVALGGLSSPIDPTEVATEGFISGGNRVEVVVSIAATSSMSTTVEPKAFVQMVVAISATSTLSVPVTAAAGVVQVVVTIGAGSAMATTVTRRPRPTPPSPTPRPRPRAGGGGGGGGPAPRLDPVLERAFAADLSRAPVETVVQGTGTPESVLREVDALIAEAHQRKVAKLKQIEAEEKEIDEVREQLAEVKRKESDQLASLLKTAATAVAVYSAVRTAIWLAT